MRLQEALHGQPISRRDLLRLAGTTGAGLAGAALLGCGSDEGVDFSKIVVPTPIDRKPSGFIGEAIPDPKAEGAKNFGESLKDSTGNSNYEKYNLVDSGYQLTLPKGSVQLGAENGQESFRIAGTPQEILTIKRDPINSSIKFEDYVNKYLRNLADESPYATFTVFPDNMVKVAGHEAMQVFSRYPDKHIAYSLIFTDHKNQEGWILSISSPSIQSYDKLDKELLFTFNKSK